MNYATFAIDLLGQPFSWGKGYLGRDQGQMVQSPQAI